MIPMRDLEDELNEAKAEAARYREALEDLTGAVDAACDFDSKQERDEMWVDHIRSVLELSLGRARAALEQGRDTREST